jgi:hypothetical protein
VPQPAFQFPAKESWLHWNLPAFPKQPLNNLVKATGSNPVEVIQIYTTIEIDGGFNQVMGDSQSPYVSILVVMVMTTG